MDIVVSVLLSLNVPNLQGEALLSVAFLNDRQKTYNITP